MHRLRRRRPVPCPEPPWLWPTRMHNEQHKRQHEHGEGGLEGPAPKTTPTSESRAPTTPKHGGQRTDRHHRRTITIQTEQRLTATPARRIVSWNAGRWSAVGHPGKPSIVDERHRQAPDTRSELLLQCCCAQDAAHDGRAYIKVSRCDVLSLAAGEIPSVVYIVVSAVR